MTSSVVAFAFVLGMVALLNPCGLPLLAVYLTAFVDDGHRGWVARVRAGVRAGFALTVGFVVVFATAGLVAGSLRAVVTAVIPPVMILVAATIVAVGALAAAGRSFSVPVPTRFRSGTGALTMMGFGGAYAIGSLSCALPVFLAAVAGSLASHSAVETGAVVVAYGIGMGTLATVLALMASFAGAAAVRPLRKFAAALPRAAGVVCVMVGLYLAAYWWGQAGGPTIVAPVTHALDIAQQAATAFVEDAWLPLGASLLALVITVTMLAAHRTSRVAVSGHDGQGEENR